MNDVFSANPVSNWVITLGIVFLVYQFFLKDKVSLESIKKFFSNTADKAKVVATNVASKVEPISVAAVDDNSDAILLDLVNKWKELRDAFEVNKNKEGVDALDAIFPLINKKG